MFSPLVILIVFLGLVALWLIATYNGLIQARNRVDAAWSDIDVQLKRRYDLIPNLVNTVKGYAAHESGTLEKVIQARNAAMQARDPGEKTQAENALAGTLKSLFALSESYPDLKANQNFLSLQEELTDTENKVQSARRFYNGLVLDFNTKLQVFPTNLIGSWLKFTPKEYFEMENEGERATPQVQF